MTRCIHCTRCVRFGQDIAGIQELGTHRPRREHADRHVHRAERRPRAVGQHHRPVPGRCAEQQAVPLPGARLGNDPAPAGVAARRLRHAPLRARTARATDARGAPAVRRDQRDLDLRSRPLQLPGLGGRRSPGRAANPRKQWELVRHGLGYRTHGGGQGPAGGRRQRAGVSRAPVEHASRSCTF